MMKQILRRYKSIVVIGLCNALLWIILYSSFGKRRIELSSCNTRAAGGTCFLLEEIRRLALHIHKAKQHVRGTKTSDYLKKAKDSVEAILREMDADIKELYKRPTRESTSVCPEKFMGTKFGLPFFEKGFETVQCDHGIPLHKLVTILKVFNRSNLNQKSFLKTADRFVSSVQMLHSGMRILLSANNCDTKSCNLMTLEKKYPSVKWINRNGVSDGEIINEMVSLAKTPYVLIARDTEVLTKDSRLERLIREIESLNLVAAAGAARNTEGKWKIGCYLSVYRNFTLEYIEGYDESFHECLYCDFVEGPFLTAKEYLIKNPFNKFSFDEGLIEDWFLRISKRKEEIMVCPDAMFHVTNKTESKNNWQKFLSQWNIFKAVTPGSKTIIRNCDGQMFSKTDFDALSHCSLQFNAEVIKAVMKTCEDKNIFCELQEGTALSSVKLGKTLPWERDVDITFLTANYSALNGLQPYFEEKGISFSDQKGVWCCADNRSAGGKFLMRYRGWYVELYGQHIMDSEVLTNAGMKPTKTQFDGMWVNVPRNPGLFVRNRYGHEIYQHAQHWMTLEQKHGWINYKTNVFKPCASPGEQDCLDRYNGDGNIQFQFVLP